VATQGHGDEEAAEIALASKPAYLGVVASRKRGKAVLDYLLDRRFTATEIERIHVPAGLDLGHTSHREVAVAILAELVQLRSTGIFDQSVKTASPALLPMIEVDEVIDLVCGMTVTAEKSNRPFEFEGTTYYFCAPGCRATFEKDPTSFINQEAKC
jgi:xanthine dehydrogenase accessory factor